MNLCSSGYRYGNNQLQILAEFSMNDMDDRAENNLIWVLRDWNFMYRDICSRLDRGGIAGKRAIGIGTLR